MTAKRQLPRFILMLTISNYLDDQNEPFNSIWTERTLTVLEATSSGSTENNTLQGWGNISNAKEAEHLN